MGEVVRFGREETLEEFIGRAGPVSTTAIAGRFAYDYRTTYRRLKALEARGVLTSELEEFSLIGSGGRMRVWSIAE